MGKVSDDISNEMTDRGGYQGYRGGGGNGHRGQNNQQYGTEVW